MKFYASVATGVQSIRYMFLPVFFYLSQRRRYMFLLVFVCLSVCLFVGKITYKRVHGFGSNVAC